MFTHPIPGREAFKHIKICPLFPSEFDEVWCLCERHAARELSLARRPEAVANTKEVKPAENTSKIREDTRGTHCVDVNDLCVRAVNAGNIEGKISQWLDRRGRQHMWG